MSFPSAAIHTLDEDEDDDDDDDDFANDGRQNKISDVVTCIKVVGAVLLWLTYLRIHAASKAMLMCISLFLNRYFSNHFALSASNSSTV